MNVADISFIGSGIAATLSLVEVCNKLLDAPGHQKITINIIEKNTEFWKGIPYGPRSSVNALTITSVYDFINEKERPAFFSWLKANKAKWAAWYREQGGITAARWLENNLPLIDNNEWETVYIPRFLFGNYLKEKVTGLILQVEERQLAVISTIQAEAIEVQRAADGLYEITIERPGHIIEAILTRKVVISAGSVPVRKMYAQNDDDVTYINDIYEPSVHENIKTLHSRLLKTEDHEGRNLLVIGSNASSIELLYLLEGMHDIRMAVNKVVIISTSGLLPYHISTAALAEHPVPGLDKVSADGGYNIETLVAAAAEDLKYALRDGANMDYVATIISTTLRLMEPLGEDAKKSFFAIHGVRLRDMFRRSGPEYKSGSQNLIDNDEVILLKGRYIDALPASNGVLLNYTDAEGHAQTFPLSFAGIINCSGSDNLDQSSSRLLRSLVENGICTMNLSGKGFEVNEKFEAAPNLYVMGPLLGGNVNKLIHFWQLENASRLTYLAPYLAHELLES